MDNQQQNTLDVKDLVKSYGGRRVVDGLNFYVAKGEVVGLLGPNGAGKTTAFYMTVGLIRPEGGAVFFQGKDITALPMHARARLGMGYLPQEPSIFRALTVEENILCVLEYLHLGAAEQARRLEELLSELKLEPFAKKRAGELSGGQRRRLEITRALATKPTCLLLDEPFANIDPLAVQDVKDIIRHLSQKGISILITDHNAREIFSIVDRSYLVQAGTVMACGCVDDLVNNDNVRRSYLGEHFRL